MPLFCRHNRFEASCPICAKEKAPAVTRAAGGAARARSATAARGGGTRPRPGGMKTRRLARETDDGYRHALIPGVKATADAERLAAALTVAAASLENREALEMPTAAELAFGDAEKVAGWRPPNEDPSWTPERRFARWFDRLRLPGTTRAQRFAFLIAIGLQPGQLFFDVKGDDATTLAAKRLLNSGDAMLLERRAAALAEATGVPIGALDQALPLWESRDELPEGALSIRKALRL